MGYLRNHRKWSWVTMGFWVVSWIMGSHGIWFWYQGFPGFSRLSLIFNVIKDSGLIWSIMYKDGRVSWEMMLPKVTSG